MDEKRKRERSRSSSAAHSRQEHEQGAAVKIEPIPFTHAETCVFSVPSLPESAADADGEYAALVQRSAALLEKLKRKHSQGGACASVDAADSKQEDTEPLTLPCTIDSVGYRVGDAPIPGARAKCLPLLCQSTASTQAEPAAHRDAATQTDGSFSVNAEKEELVSELGELFTLFHVYFA